MNTLAIRKCVYSDIIHLHIILSKQKASWKQEHEICWRILRTVLLKFYYVMLLNNKMFIQKIETILYFSETIIHHFNKWFFILTLTKIYFLVMKCKRCDKKSDILTEKNDTRKLGMQCLQCHLLILNFVGDSITAHFLEKQYTESNKPHKTIFLPLCFYLTAFEFNFINNLPTAFEIAQ